MDTIALKRELRRMLLARTTSFSLGVPGVLAEFHWGADERPEHDDGALAIASGRGAISITPAAGVHDTVVAGGGRLWWLPGDAAASVDRRGLAEIGPDARAVREEDRAHRLFDMGLALGHVRACVRCSDPALTRLLRRHAGEDVLAAGHPAMAAIKAASPHRVFTSCMARIEVFAPIPSRARGEPTPNGPHTHVLPALLGSDDPDAASLPAGARVVLRAHGLER